MRPPPQAHRDPNPPDPKQIIPLRPRIILCSPSPSHQKPPPLRAFSLQTCPAPLPPGPRLPMPTPISTSPPAQTSPVHRSDLSNSARPRARKEEQRPPPQIPSVWGRPRLRLHWPRLRRALPMLNSEIRFSASIPFRPPHRRKQQMQACRASRISALRPCPISASQARAFRTPPARLEVAPCLPDSPPPQNQGTSIHKIPSRSTQTIPCLARSLHSEPEMRPRHHMTTPGGGFAGPESSSLCSLSSWLPSWSTSFST